MSVQAIAAVFKHSASKGASRLVLLALADVANDEGEVTAYKRSYSVLASKANVAKASIQRAVENLVDAGELRVLGTGGGRGSSDYQIVLPGLVDEYAACPQRVPSVPTTSTEGTQDGYPVSPSLSVEVPSLAVSSAAPTTDAEVLPFRNVGQQPEAPVAAVFAAWQESTGKSRTVLDAKRRKLIRDSLRLYSPEDLIAAVRGWRHSPHHRGENDQRTIYNGIELLLRDPAHIEKFRDLEANGEQLPMSGTAHSLRAWAANT